MKDILRRLLWMALLVAGQQAGAAEVDVIEARAIRAVIESQLTAMAAGDAVHAFALASPSIRLQFGDAPTFMRMVREGYPMLIRPAAVSFLRPETVRTGVKQTVHVQDTDGRNWLASYHMIKQGDGSWRINGCYVRVDEGDSMT
jgi:hypothetical protein